jgi:hypothetical protein
LIREKPSIDKALIDLLPFVSPHVRYHLFLRALPGEVPEGAIQAALELSGQDITGEDLERAFTRAAGRPIRYQRFPESLLADNAFLRELTALVDNGVVAGVADTPALEVEFGRMLKLEEWLAGRGKALFDEALNAP